MTALHNHHQQTADDRCGPCALWRYSATRSLRALFAEVNRRADVKFERVSRPCGSPESQGLFV